MISASALLAPSVAMSFVAIGLFMATIGFAVGLDEIRVDCGRRAATLLIGLAVISSARA
jgi:hypothetical protein